MAILNPLERPVCLADPLRLAPSQWAAHVPFAMFLVDVLRPRAVVELGTHAGVSYCAFCQAVKALEVDCRCRAIDTWEGDEHSGLYGPEVFEDLKAHHDPLYGSFSSLVRSTFDDALPLFEDGSIDLLHIDGYHTYEAVSHDFGAWLPKMSDRGVIILHDTDERWPGFGVWKFWEEIKRRYPHFEFTHEHGLGLVATGPRRPDGLGPLLDASEADAAVLRDFFRQLGGRLRARLDSERQADPIRSLSDQLDASAQSARSLSNQLSANAEIVQSLSNQLSAGEEIIQSLSAQLSEKDAILAGILRSRSWRLIDRYARAKARLLAPYKALRRGG
jgi:Methyltransferase domain